VIRYFAGLAFLTRVVSNVAVYEAYTKYMATRDRRHPDSNGHLVVELPRMEELFSGQTFFDFLVECFGVDGDKFYSKAGGYQFDGEMPPVLKTVSGFRTTFYRLLDVMSDGWIEEHRYKGTPMVISHAGEEAASAAQKRKLKSSQQKVLENMAVTFTKSLENLGGLVFGAGSSNKEKANGMFLMQKVMEDLRKVVEEPFGFVHPLCSSLSTTKYSIYAGFGGKKGAELLVAAEAEEGETSSGEERAETAAEAPKAKKKTKKKKKRKKGQQAETSQASESDQGTKKTRRKRTEAASEKYRRMYHCICNTPEEILTAMLLDKYRYGGTQRGREEVLFSAAQHYPLSIYTLEHIFCKLWLLTYNANHHVFGKKHPNFDKKYTFPVRCVDEEHNVYPWDDPMNPCSARMAQCAKLCMYQYDCLCEHKNTCKYENEAFDLTDQKTFFPGSLMLQESVPSFTVPSTQPRQLLLGSTWDRVDTQTTNESEMQREESDEEMSFAGANPSVRNSKTPTIDDMDVDETSELGAPNSSAHLCTQSQSGASLPSPKRKRDGGDGSDSGNESSDSSFE